MNDDFLYKFHKAPRREFAASLYDRISGPMNTSSRTQSFRSIALVFSVVMVIAVTLFFSPTTRTLAESIIRQFGVFVFVQAPPESEPIKNGTTGQQVVGSPEKKDPMQDQAQQLKKQPQANENYAQDAAAASQLAGFTVLTPAEPPDGYTIKNTSGAWTVVFHENGEVRASISYENQVAESFLTIEELKGQPGLSKTVELPEVIDVTVRGQPGVWMPDGHRKNTLVWEENGITYLIISNQLSLDEVLKVAESLGN